MCYGNIELIICVNLQEKIPEGNFKCHASSVSRFIEVVSNLFCSLILLLNQAKTKHICHEQS